MSTDKIKVAVRVRPYNKRELDLKTECVVNMDDNHTYLQIPDNPDKDNPKSPKSFAFDHCFNSYLDPNDAKFSSQEKVFEALGLDLLDNAFDGYNACIFAYGQTGSGKSYTMLGSLESQGIIPRLCNALFERIAEKSEAEAERWQSKVEVSYMEIYNEKVHDLLNPTTSSRQGLKVREHSVLGPYVDGLSQLAVISYQEIDDLMIEGNKSRTVASTNMNNESSRSHAVFSVVLTQTLTDVQSGVSGEKVSRISLVDLAGSERANKTGAVGERLKEGSNINKSLTTLGLVISKLADQGKGSAKKDNFVPYRDSTLTWLLKDNLGGNSRTVMVATISPAADNYEETLSTLRYADRAKRIVNHAVVNEDPNARIIRELRAEVDALKEMLKHASQPEVLREKLCENEKLMKEISLTWEEKLQKTGQTQEDRRQALEKVGISVQAVDVEKDKHFLVNLNSDPSLSELLVYYLKKSKTRVGRAGDPSDPDIQLSGVGVQPQHCEIELNENDKLILNPLNGARTCVNGVEVKEATRLKNGDRILWGSNHFFRVNCPKDCSSEPEATPFDWEMAMEEVMKADVSNDPIQTAIAKLERQYEEDKQSALQKQRQEYEKQFLQLKNYMSPSTAYPPSYIIPQDSHQLLRGVPYSGNRPISNQPPPATPMTMSKLEKWGRERDDTFKRSLAKLRDDIIRANGLVREANFFSEELKKSTRFSVTLQIPPHNLSPNRKRGSFASEPAILVKRKGKTNQIWSVDKLNMKLIDIRAMIVSQDPSQHEDEDPFYENSENHNLIGVANIFLSCLYEDVEFDYSTPIISQQGEVAGRLQVQIQKVKGMFPFDRLGHYYDNNSESSSETSKYSNYDLANEDNSSITIKVTVKKASGLPPSLSHFVFCRYSLWGTEEVVVVPPAVHSDTEKQENDIERIKIREKTRKSDSLDTFKFDHVREFNIQLTEEFLEHCSDGGALSIEVYGHQSEAFATSHNLWTEEEQQAKARSLADRWSELTRKLQFEVEVQELNESGDYGPVEVQPRTDVGTGGIFQLRQGQQRRILVAVKPVQNSGTLPIICEQVMTVTVGCPGVRSKLQKPLDSYQEEDLNQLRKRWNEALERRSEYLDSHIQKYINKKNKSEAESEREQSLIDQWVCLTEERNSVMCPNPGSGVPGAPADWDPPDGMEHDSPVLFLDLNADDLSTGYTETGEIPLYGLNSILPKEHGGKFFDLQIIGHLENKVGAVATWDSSIHDSLCLNRVTPANERAYLIVKSIVRLSHPTVMDLVLRKRICVNVYKRHSITDTIRRRMGHTSSLTSLSVQYEIASNIPKASEELEDRESLAVMAASGLQEEISSDSLSSAEDNSNNKQNFIEQYTQGISAVETILTLDKLRQSVVVKELLKEKQVMVSSMSSSQTEGTLLAQMQQQQSQSQFMRKTVSVPNFTHVTSSLSLDNLSNLLRTSESFSSDLNSEQKMNVSSNSSKILLADHDPNNLASNRPTSLNLNFSLNTTSRHQNNGNNKTSPNNNNNNNNNNNGSSATTAGAVSLSSSVAGGKKQPFLSTLPEEMEGDETNNTTTTTSLHLVEPVTISTSQGERDSQTIKIKSSQIKSGYADWNDDSNSVHNLDPTKTNPANERLNEEKPHNGTLRVEEPIIDEEKTPSNTTTENDLILSSKLLGNHLAEEDKATSHIKPANHLAEEEEEYEAATSDVSVGNNGNNDFLGDPKRHSDNHCSSLELEEEEDQDHHQVDSEEEVGKKNNNNNRISSSFSVGDEECCSSLSRASDLSNSSTSEKLSLGESTPTLMETSLDLSKVPDWLVVGESVQVRPGYTSGVIAFVGPTEFAGGLWIGIELDAPTGKNDGSVQGVRYFGCAQKRGVFVRVDKVQLDKRGRLMRQQQQQQQQQPNKSTSNRGAQKLSNGGLKSNNRTGR